MCGVDVRSNLLNLEVNGGVFFSVDCLIVCIS